MKPLSTLTFAAVLSTIAPTISATAAINCGSLPSCADLGYTDIVAQCPGKSLKCPFDMTQGTCIYEAAVGEIAYFAAPKENKAWLPCDGRTYPRAKYPELAAFLDYHPMDNESTTRGNIYCNNAKHASSCGADVFAVPDYRGYFLKVTGMWNPSTQKSYNNNYFIGGTVLGLADASKAPQAEQLPNITGTFGMNGKTGADNKVFTKTSTSSQMDGISNGDKSNGAIKFDASQTEGTGKGVYTEGGHVLPANYGVWAYIYAGKVVQ